MSLEHGMVNLQQPGADSYPVDAATELELLLFTLEGQRCGLPLHDVERIVPAAEITPLPKAPAVVLGVIDVEGTILPVLSMRRRFGFAEREIRITDQFLLAHTSRRRVVLVIDEAQQVRNVSADRITRAKNVVPGFDHLRGVAALDDGLVLIHDLETFLSLEEAVALDEAMRTNEGGAHGS